MPHSAENRECTALSFPTNHPLNTKVCSRMWSKDPLCFSSFWDMVYLHKLPPQTVIGISRTFSRHHQQTNTEKEYTEVFETPSTKKKEWKEYITNAAAATRTDSHVGLFGHSRCCCVTWTVPECKDHSPVTKDRLQGLSSLQIFCKVELGFQPSILRAAHCAKVHPGFSALWKLLSILKGSKLNGHPTHPGPI